MTYSERHLGERERDWIRDERERARGAFDHGGQPRIERSYDYQAAERDFGPEGYMPYGVSGPTNYDGGYPGVDARRHADAVRPYPRDIPRGRHAGSDYVPNPREGRGEEARTWWDRTQDEVQAMFGDSDARRRRQWDELRMAARPHGEHRGRGPRGYRRSDERIAEDVSDRLTDDAWLDASNITVEVKGGEVTLAGTVADRADKRRAEDIADMCSGVGHVQNNLRVKAMEARGRMDGDRDTLETGGTAASQATTRASGRH